MSRDDLTVVDMTGRRMDPPEHLNEAQASEWRSVVDSFPADYFRPSDASLLAAYCMASAFYKEAAAEMAENGVTMDDGRGRRVTNPAHAVLTSQASAMAQMAVKLRLCPSARYSEKVAATKAGARASPARPWERQASEG